MVMVSKMFIWELIFWNCVDEDEFGELFYDADGDDNGGSGVGFSGACNYRPRDNDVAVVAAV